MGMVNNGSAYSVVLDSVTGKPRITFSNQVTMACGNDKLSCALESNIFGGQFFFCSPGILCCIVTIQGIEVTQNDKNMQALCFRLGMYILLQVA
jgi:hypothetical protein